MYIPSIIIIVIIMRFSVVVSEENTENKPQKRDE